MGAELVPSEIPRSISSLICTVCLSIQACTYSVKIDCLMRIKLDIVGDSADAGSLDSVDDGARAVASR